MSAAVLEAALLAKLAGDAAVKALLGDPPRVFDAAVARPAYPYLEIVRHESQPVDSAGAEADEHTIDFALFANERGRMELKEAVAAVRAALKGEPPEMEGWRCVLLFPLFADMVQTRFGRWRAMLRVRAIIEPTG